MHPLWGYCIFVQVLHASSPVQPFDQSELRNPQKHSQKQRVKAISSNLLGRVSLEGPSKS